MEGLPKIGDAGFAHRMKLYWGGHKRESNDLGWRTGCMINLLRNVVLTFLVLATA